MQDSAGRIWLGGTNGLVCYDNQYQRLFSLRDSLPDKRVAAMLEWKRNRILIGTRGLYELVVDDKGIHSFQKMTIFPDNRFIYCMEQDSLGRIWMGTDRGLYRLDLNSSELRAFDIADNIQVQVFNSNGLFLSGNGLLFAGGRMGLNYLNPYVERTRSKPLKPILESASFGNDDSSFFLQYPPLVLSHLQRKVDLRIAVPEFAAPYMLRYKYRINGSEEWTDNGQNDQVVLRELPPGNYQIDIAVSRDAVIWYEQENVIHFIISKPWWKQWWFRIAVLGAVVALAWLIRRYRKQKKEEAEFQAAVDYFAHSAYEQASTEDILWDICRKAITRLGLEDCVIYLLDEERQILVQKAAFGAKSNSGFEVVNPIEIPVGEAIVGHVAATGKAAIIKDTTRDSRYLADDKPRLSELTVPIVHQNKVIGIIDSEHSRRNFFRQIHLDTLQRIASLCASKISRSMAIAELKKAEEKLQSLNTKITATKYMNLRLQMNPHFLFNALNSIQHLIVAQQTNEAYRYLSIFSRFLRSVLQYADKTVIRLDEEIQMLEMYISLEQLGSDKRFTYQILTDENLETDEVLIPPLIIQPLVENAIWHGLMPAEGEKHLNISFEENSDDQLVCVVEDNGIGREAAAQLEKRKMGQLAYESKSTAIIRERLELLKEKTGKDAAIQVEDKKLNGRASGTRVTVIIPYYNRDEV
jgi:putative methionine-R-sulfoxide reductase with GAF domain/two-component sensor histidine kinase